MAFFVRNISDNYAWILKNQLGPGDTLNLHKVFQGFCKPKRSHRAEEPKFAEFNENEFEDFMDWVRTEIVLDKGVFEIIDDDTLPEASFDDGLTIEEKKQRRRAMRKAATPRGDTKVRVDKEKLDEIKSKKTTHKQVGRKLPSEKDLSPKEIAWLPYDGMSKQIIDGIGDARRLKSALRLARNLSGQERTRKLIEDRLNELAASGR